MVNIEEIVDTEDNKNLEDINTISTYEEDFESEISVPIAMPKPSSPDTPEPVPSLVPIMPSSRSLLNRYYKEQLLSFLYKV